MRRALLAIEVAVGLLIEVACGYLIGLAVARHAHFVDIAYYVVLAISMTALVAGAYFGWWCRGFTLTLDGDEFR